MNTAAREKEAPEDECLPTEIPALLVAGGSCSRLCRPQRAAPDDDGLEMDTQVIKPTETLRAAARE